MFKKLWHLITGPPPAQPVRTAAEIFPDQLARWEMLCGKSWHKLTPEADPGTRLMVLRQVRHSIPGDVVGRWVCGTGPTGGELVIYAALDIDEQLVEVEDRELMFPSVEDRAWHYSQACGTGRQ